jgi:hypothetical protein
MLAPTSVANLGHRARSTEELAELRSGRTDEGVCPHVCNGEAGATYATVVVSCFSFSAW